MKKGRISLEDQMYICENYTEKSVSFLAKKLNRSEAAIQKIIDEVKKNTQILEENPKAEPHKEKGFAIMDVGLSQRGDDARTVTKKITRDDCIFRPKG